MKGESGVVGLRGGRGREMIQRILSIAFELVRKMWLSNDINR
jgi:hypothetical protein